MINEDRANVTVLWRRSRADGGDCGGGGRGWQHNKTPRGSRRFNIVSDSLRRQMDGEGEIVSLDDSIVMAVVAEQKRGSGRRSG